MAEMTTNDTRTSSPSTSSGPLVLPPGQVPSGISQQESMMIYLPKADTSFQKHESTPLASPVSNENGAHSQITDFGTKNSPLNQIMQALGHSTAGFLKLLVGIIRLIPGLAKS